MFAELYVTASGMAVRQEKIDVLAHNLANANTVGFKMGEVVLEERPLEIPGGRSEAPSHVRLVERRTDFSPGELQYTGEPLDVALGQEGFFVIQTPEGIRLSRDGHFSLDGVHVRHLQMAWENLHLGGLLERDPLGHSVQAIPQRH